MTQFELLPRDADARGEPVPLADQVERDLIREALDETLVVEAAAGTGKTTELVRRMVAVLEAGRATLDRMVAVTFTDLAAGELKLRLRTGIEEARLDPARHGASRERLSAALPKLEEARIGTIHSFCADLLRERPIEAGVDPRFEVLPDDLARPLFDRAFARWFEQQLESPGPAVSRILRRRNREPVFGARRFEEGPRALLRRAAWQLIEHRDFPEPWRHEPGFDREPRIDALLEEMESLAEWGRRGEADDWLVKSLLEIGKVVEEVRRAERVHGRDYDALEALLGEVARSRHRHWAWRGRARGGDPEFPRDELRRRRDALRESLERFAADSGADLAPRLRDELWPVVEAYEAAKERTGCLDFQDLLIRARDLVREHAAVRRELQRRFTHYFVDEFQDTDPLQVEILMLLAAGDPEASEWREARTVPGKLFLVGDPKQSIYRFRRADVELYREIQRRLVAQGARLVPLTVSFRAVPEIQQAVNAAFAPRMGAGDGSPSGAGFGYVPLDRHRPGHREQPAVIALPVPAPYGDYGTIVEWRIQDSLPDVTAAWIEWLLKESGWTVTERERPGERVPVEARHVCVLFRRFRALFEDVTRPYAAALEARGIQHLLVGGSSFHQREEIEALRNALAAIERPDDELAVFATLRGPLLALSDASLLLWRARVGGLHPFRPVAADSLPAALAEVAEAHALLRDLHRGRNRRPVADTIAQLLERTRAYAAFAVWPTGTQALANIGRLLDLARRAEQQGLVSFRAFVDRLEDEADRGETAEAPLLEEGVQGVRIMTVHKAKGLEFPIVVLADMTAKETLDQPTRWTDPARRLCVQRLAGCTPPELRDHGAEEMDREREEALRLLYVAATRARDALVVPVLGDDRRESWIQALEPVVYPSPERGRAPRSATAPGCPPFGEESTPGRPSNVARPLLSVMPGLHAPESGDHQVVWWDPATLRLGARPSMGLTQTRILEADDEGRSDAAVQAHGSWQSARETILETASGPSRKVVAATRFAHSEAPIEGAEHVEVIELEDRGAGRPRGARFGALVHAVLASARLDDDEDAVSACAAVHARLLGADEEERDRAAAIVTRTLAHPVLKRAAEAARQGLCRRESSIVVRLEDGTLPESVADLAFLVDGVWTVVDFKTDREVEGALPAYRRQVALYVQGIREATGMLARGVLLIV